MASSCGLEEDPISASYTTDPIFTKSGELDLSGGVGQGSLISLLGGVLETNYPSFMITPEEARKLDPTLSDLSDAELTRALEILYNLADIALDLWARDHKAGSKVPGGGLQDQEGLR